MKKKNVHWEEIVILKFSNFFVKEIEQKKKFFHGRLYSSMNCSYTLFYKHNFYEDIYAEISYKLNKLKHIFKL